MVYFISIYIFIALFLRQSMLYTFLAVIMDLYHQIDNVHIFIILSFCEMARRKPPLGFQWGVLAVSFVLESSYFIFYFIFLLFQLPHETYWIEDIHLAYFGFWLFAAARRTLRGQHANGRESGYVLWAIWLWIRHGHRLTTSALRLLRWKLRIWANQSQGFLATSWSWHYKWITN